MNNSSEDSNFVHAPSTIFKLVVYTVLAVFFTAIIAALASIAFEENSIVGGVIIGLVACIPLFVVWKLWHVRVPTPAEVAVKEKERLEKERLELSKASSGSSTDSDSAILFIFFWLPLICGLLYLLFTSAPWWAAVIILLLLVIVLS